MLTPEQLQVGRKLRLTDHFGEAHVGVVKRIVSDKPCAITHVICVDGYPDAEFYVGRFECVSFRSIEPYEEPIHADAT